ncbi:DUF559 domain-containing protein [Cysteiniphilum sp. QT6929]|uniref:endonuclease domain-containing protein n=1 Tax=Cysteiniphilum sp. QT6929 TaxID=2975055 RepID=UPI0024B3449B|nr:DUF559 domain-containing protein [Cysteiniphilum sp. QT6929]WHN64964.1 DUF559 domain-containing protein [Cysteiniphilum sp. QT6929]
MYPWDKLPQNNRLKVYARELRKAGNLSEVLLWQQLKAKQLLGFKFDRQKIIGHYIVDFYCHSLGVVIEVDGYSHDFKVAYDAERESYLRQYQLQVIHILDQDVKRNLQGVMDYLKCVLESRLQSIDGQYMPRI